MQSVHRCSNCIYLHLHTPWRMYIYIHIYIYIRSKGVGTREAWVWGPSRVFAPRLAPTAAHRFLSAALHALHRHPPPPPRLGVQLSFLPHTPFRSLRYSTMQPRPLHRRPKCTRTRMHTVRHTYRLQPACVECTRKILHARGWRPFEDYPGEEDAKIEPSSRAPASKP